METAHELASPFPFTRGDYEVQDEICTCGHHRSEHSDSAFTFGHGSCTRCWCTQFTYAGDVTNYRGS